MLVVLAAESGTLCDWQDAPFACCIRMHAHEPPQAAHVRLERDCFGASDCSGYFWSLELVAQRRIVRKSYTHAQIAIGAANRQ